MYRKLETGMNGQKMDTNENEMIEQFSESSSSSTLLGCVNLNELYGDYETKRKTVIQTVKN